MRMLCGLTGSLLVATLLVSLCGCGSLQRTREAMLQGQGGDFAAVDLKGYVREQDDVRKQLAMMAFAAGPSLPVEIKNMPVAPMTEWDALIDAGMNYADSRCQTYLSALYRLDRERRAAVTEIGLVGTATAGVMAAAKSAAKDVAIVAILFGLAASTVDNVAGGVLYELPPSTVGSMVNDQQLAFRRALQRGYSSWPAALTVIQGYAIICVPAHIENEINIALKKSNAGTTDGDPKTGQPPAVSNALAANPSGDFGMDATSQILLNFVRNNRANHVKLQAYLDANENKISVGSLITVGSNTQARVRAAKAMNLIQ